MVRQNIVFVYATRIILRHNVSGIAVNTLLVGYATGVMRLLMLEAKLLPECL